ncbi:hypothetical protein RIVM261_063940 [Rivularia sp. IAM M-261]|nr:hypothetical protein CAL7716_050380 [Calothrix sp. PCC 7716]GJD21438.1 hypothetical protein RIVM261_063940 [Rivularia sp. IAM M-261]
MENSSLRSAEAKAVERIKNIDKTEWIVVLEADEKINISKINERLEKRGYNIQLSTRPCK